MKSIAWIFSLALIAGGIWYFTSWTQTATQQPLHHVSQPIIEEKTQKEKKKKNIVFTPKVQTHIDKNATNNTQIQEVVMKLADIDAIIETVKPREYVEPVAALTLDTSRLYTLKTGDIFKISDLEGKDYQISINQVAIQGDDKIIQGSFHDENISYPILITTGASGSTFIHLDTPSKTYEIELEDGKGYAYDSMEIRRTLSDESKDDFIVVEPKKSPKEQNPIME